jgi:hypothetical protein
MFQGIQAKTFAQNWLIEFKRYPVFRSMVTHEQVLYDNFSYDQFYLPCVQQIFHDRVRVFGPPQ